MIKSILKKWPILIFTGMFLLNAAQAQEHGPLAEFEKLKNLIEFAREVLADFGTEETRKLLAEAEGLKQKAEQAIAERRFRDARLRIEEATKLVQAALAIVLRTSAQQLRAQLDELVRRAENEVIGSGNREAERLLQEAKKNLQHGDRAAQGRRLEAVGHYRVARELLERALKLVQGSSTCVAYLAELAAKAQESVERCNNPLAKNVYEQGLKQKRLAEEAFRRGDQALAENLCNGANRLLLRALALCPGQGQAQDEGQLKSELQALRDMLARAEERLAAGSAPRPGMRALLGQARKLAYDAEAALARQQYAQAQRYITSGRNLIEATTRSAGIPALEFEKQCEAELQQLQRDVQEVETRAQESSRSEAQTLVELARRSYVAAERICARRPHTLRSVAAFRMMARVAQSFLLQAEGLLQETAAAAPDREALRQRLQELDATLEEVKASSTAEESGFARILIEQATELRHRAQTAYQTGQLNVSFETATIAFELLREALKLSN